MPITDNGAVNTARTFTVTLSGAAGATLGTPASTTVTISDDDNTLQFSAATATVAEGTATLNLSVTRLGGAAATASVDWASADGTALSGSDFGAQGVPVPLTGTLNWGAGDAASKTIAIPILNDLVVEGAKTFTVNLSNVAGTGANSIGTNATITVTINDNDAGVVLSAANYNVSETGATVTITANRIGPATAAATVTWTTSNGTATAGTDFGTSGSGVQRTGTITWTAGTSTPKTFTIPILNDALAEGSESFNVTLSNPSAGIVLGTPSSATVTIVDDDIPPESTVQFTVGKTTVLESAATVDVTVSRTGGAYTFAGSVNYATAAGTALVTSDFTTRTGTLTWGSGDSTSRTITVPVTNDAVAELLKSTVTLSAPTPGIGLGTPASTTVRIQDDDEVFPPEGEFPAGWVMPGGANASWHVSNDAGPHEGALALRTDSIFDNEVAQVEIGGAWLAGTVSFRVKISSEPTFDVLRFLIDGVEAARWSGTANTTWQAVQCGCACRRSHLPVVLRERRFRLFWGRMRLGWIR